MAGRKKLPLLTPEERLIRTSRTLPLIGEGWNRGVEKVTPKGRDPGCRDCSLGAEVRTPCMPAYVTCTDDAWVDNQLLIVGSTPTKLDDSEGGYNPMGLVGQVLDEAAKHWRGEIRYTSAVSCSAGKEISEDSLIACRPYLAAEVLTGAKRILAVGDLAVRSLFGHRASTIGNRRSWGHVFGVPTFTLFNPQVTLYNRFAKEWWKADTQWALTTQVQPLSEGEVTVLLNCGEVQSFLTDLFPGDVTTVDCEWTGSLWYDDFSLLCVGLCQDLLRPAVIPGDLLRKDGQAREALTRWLSDSWYPKGGHNFKEDRHALWRAGLGDVVGTQVDTLLWARQRESDNPAGLKSLAWNVGMGGYAGDAKDDAEDEEGKKDFARLEPDTLHLYNARDVVVTQHVRKWLEPQMERYRSTWEQLLRPAQTALVQVERWGALLSQDNVRAYDLWLSQRLEKIEAGIRQHTPPEFNPASTKQVQDLLFKQLGVKPDPKRKTGTGAWSTDKAALEAYKSQHDVIPLLQEHSNYRKQKASFGLGVLEHVGFDGRVHPSYRVVRSGRLSCRAPNLQQVTSPGIKPGEPGYEEKRGEDEGVWARDCYVAPDGYVLTQLDYAQMELRVAAMLAGDEVMAAAFEAGHDFHRMTASAAYNIRPEDVNAEQRRVSKVINFAIIFGMDEYGIANSTGIPKAKAKELLQSLLGKYKKFDAWRRQQMAQTVASGESFVRWNPPGGNVDWAHRRDNRGAGETGTDRDSEGVRKHAANVALNGPIQTIANCFSLASLSETVRWILDEDVPAKVVITVHDSILLEAREDVAEEVAARVSRIMCSWPSGVVKLKADAELGVAWGSMSKIKVK